MASPCLLRWIAVVLLISHVSTGPAYTLCYFACMGPCCAATGGPGAAVCAAICAASCGPTAPACLSDNSIAFRIDSVGVPHETAVQNLVPGDYVLTLSQGRSVATKVLHNHRSRGTFSFKELVAEHRDRVFNLTVTDDHNLVWLSRDKQTSINPGEHDWDISLARLVKVGDLVPVMTTDETGSHGASDELARLTSVRQVHMNVKNTLITESGTMLANGILVTTICDGDTAVDPPTFHATMQKWRKLHEGFETCTEAPAKSR